MSDRDILDEQIHYYRQRSTHYDEEGLYPGDHYASQSHLLEAALDRYRPSGDVLEIACGTGRWTQVILRHAGTVTALDSSPEMLAITAAKVQGPKVRLIEADVFAWVPDRRRYDCVVFANWLSHVPQSRFEEFWTTIAAALTQGGSVFFLDEADGPWRTEEFIEGSDVPLAIRRLRDGSTHRVVKIFWEPDALESRLRELGWAVTIQRLGPFYCGSGTYEGIAQERLTAELFVSPSS